jgi:hypothetical protein
MGGWADVPGCPFERRHVEDMHAKEALYDVAETWRETVLVFETAHAFRDPVRDCCIVADFAGPDGMHIRREAFWDGGNRYGVSFAALKAGT